MKNQVLIVLILLFTTVTAFSKKPRFKAGYWYASLQLTDNDFLPLIIEVEKVRKSSRFSILNGSERIILDQIQAHGDSVIIAFPAFASEIRAVVHSDSYISGNWYNYAKKGNYFLPFWSKFQYSNRYTIQPATIDVNGKWEVTFDYDKERYKSVGIFNTAPVKGIKNEMLTNRVTGTFLTETGDYRFLEGAVIKDSLYLSAFDGSHAFLFKGQLVDDTLWGEFLSGNHYRSKWFALRNENFELGHPDSLTTYSIDSKISFSLPDLDGSVYQYPDDAPNNTVTLIQIMGTWCPNCLDESLYLKELKNKFADKLEILAVTFETQVELTEKIKKVRSYRTNLNLPYTFLIGGDACKSCATELFPGLSEIISFPTLIFIDKSGAIRKVHTGFNGPGTGEYYQIFVEATDHFIQQLIEE